MLAVPVTRDLEAARRLLCEQLLTYLDDIDPALREDMFEALEVEGKLLHRPASPLDGRWALLPLYLAGELRAGAEPGHAARAAALAMECLICSTDLFDDGMDEDRTPLVERLGAARVLNVALALVSLVQRILLSLLDKGCTPAQSACLLNCVQCALLQAAGGQQRDLLAEQRAACELSREECIEIAAAKAGALLSLACRLGALCAGVEEARIEQCAEMGRLLGIAAQLDNDAHDLAYLLPPTARAASSQKSDLARGKKTLPVVLAAHSLRTTHAPDAGTFDASLRQMAARSEEANESCVCALREGILTTWGVALLYRERARDYLRMLTGGRPASPALCHILGFADGSLVESKERKMGMLGGKVCITHAEDASASGAGC